MFSPSYQILALKKIYLVSNRRTKLANQIMLASNMGFMEGMVYDHKVGLDVESYLNAISIGLAGSKSLDLFGNRILKRDFAPGFYMDHFVKDLGICLKECQNMGIALPGLALAQQLHVSLLRLMAKVIWELNH